MNKIVYDVVSRRIPNQTGTKIRKEGDYYVALSPIMGAFISMNRLAGKIYTMVDGKKSIDDIIKIILSMYEKIDEEKIKEDVCKCISDLESFNLITVVKGGTKWKK